MTKQRKLAEEKVKQATFEFNEIIRQEQERCAHVWGLPQDAETHEYMEPYIIQTCLKCGLTKHVK